MAIVRFKHYPTPGFRTVNNPLFHNDISQFVGRENFNANPKVNILENETGFHIELAAPGLKKEDFKIKIDKDILTISVEKEVNSEEASGKYTRREFGFTSFERSFTLPETVDQANIIAGYENGILNLTLPKLEEVNRTMEIQVS
ncbi:MAG: Hsp20/alpha crystallin family protein [Bacteroidetes bacterium]|nr:Hsp20/alpha crystallin family protein [Bacteroidota bacterium]